MSARNESTRFEWVPDFAQYRELRWLDANHYVAPLSVVLALFCLEQYAKVGGRCADLIFMSDGRVDWKECGVYSVIRDEDGHPLDVERHDGVRVLMGGIES